MKRGFLVLTLVAGLLAVGMAAAQEVEQELEQEVEAPFVTVSGTGEVQARPDIAKVQVGVVTQAESADRALEANNQAMEQLLTRLQELGVAKQDIRTTRFDVSPQYKHDREGRTPPEIVGYQVTNLVEITVRDLAKLGQILDEVVRQGANRIHGIGFSLDDPTGLMDEARRQAMADARRKAELLAQAAGATLGPPLVIQEQTVGGPQPVFARGVQLGEAVRAVPVEPGQQTLTARVSVTYRLQTGQEP